MSAHKQRQFDIVIIGAGSAGLSVASGAAQLGLDVALIEKDKMGGDCLNTGCVPSKSILASAKVAQTMRKAKAFGIQSVEPEIDFSGVKDHVFGVIKKIEPHDFVERFEGLGVTVIKDEAKFTSKNTVVLKNGDILKGCYFVVATGSRAFMPSIEGLDKSKIYTNENIFELREKPSHLVIIGGGPIGIEMAQAHSRLGIKVTVLDGSSILAKDDPEHVKIIRDILVEEGIEIIENARVDHVTHLKNGETDVAFEQDGKVQNIKASHLLIATGRQPNVDGLDLDKAGIEYNEKGIKVDKRLRTSNKKIYAAGDVSGGPQFTHVAGYHAGIIIKNVIFKIPSKVDYSALPWVTYTDPEVAQVGLTEAAARKKHGDSIKTVTWSFNENDRAMAEKKTQGQGKVIMLKNGKVIGASIVGPSAGDLIGVWSVIISSDMKIGAVANIIAPYPTLGEINKRLAGAYYTPSLFSDKTKFIVSLLQKLPF